MTDTPGVPSNEANNLTANVLIVDDDPMILGVISMLVQSLGHKCHSATDGQEAVEVFRSKPEAFSLVIMDVEMPHLDGIEASLKIREIDPSAKVILLSGYTKKDVWKAKPNGFVLKSFMHIELRELIARLMEPEVPDPV